MRVGWWLASRLDKSVSGWAPSAYLEEYIVSKPVPPPPGRPKPPAPPAKRPAARKPVADTTRDSGYSGSGIDMGARDSGGSIAGGLAEALRQRQAAMQAKGKREDEW